MSHEGIVTSKGIPNLSKNFVELLIFRFTTVSKNAVCLSPTNYFDLKGAIYLAFNLCQSLILNIC